MARATVDPLKNPTLFICNDDYNTPKSNIPIYVPKFRPLMGSIQEGKNEDYRQLLGNRYGVQQKMRNEGTQGVAIFWDKKYLEIAATQNDDGWKFLADNQGLLARGNVWQDLLIRGTDFQFTLASTHRPPIRYRYLWPVFDKNLRLWIESRKLPVIIGMDSNQTGGPDPLTTPRRRWHGSGIDGALEEIGGHWMLNVLPKKTSDHNSLMLRSAKIEKLVQR